MSSALASPYRVASDPRQDEQEAGGQEAEHQDDDEQRDAEARGVSRLRVEGQHVPCGHPAAGPALLCGRKQGVPAREGDRVCTAKEAWRQSLAVLMRSGLSHPAELLLSGRGPAACLAALAQERDPDWFYRLPDSKQRWCPSQAPGSQPPQRLCK